MSTPAVHRYGPASDQFLELTLPDGDGPAPVAVVVHGGFWRAPYGIELARPLAADLAGRGWAAVAVEYHRVGAGGGWPATLADVAAAVDALPDLPGASRLDLDDVAVVGHSAGGHLAAWLAGRGALPPGAPGAAPRVRVTTAVLQAGVLDLAAAAAAGLGDGATQALLGGGPDDVPDRYALADPARLLPTGATTLCVHGLQDTSVPPAQSEGYAAAAARAGDRVDLDLVPGDHMVLIDVAGDPWRRTVEWLSTRPTAARHGTTLDP